MKAKVKIQRDLKKIKTKVVFNLTLRQIICFSIGALIGLPTYFFMRKAGNETVGMFAMIIVMLPAFLFAMYERDGLPLEQILLNYWRWNHERPKKRVKKKKQSLKQNSGQGGSNPKVTANPKQQFATIQKKSTSSEGQGGEIAGEIRQHEKTEIRRNKIRKSRKQKEQLRPTVYKVGRDEERQKIRSRTRIRNQESEYREQKCYERKRSKKLRKESREKSKHRRVVAL